RYPHRHPMHRRPPRADAYQLARQGCFAPRDRALLASQPPQASPPPPLALIAGGPHSRTRLQIQLAPIACLRRSGPCRFALELGVSLASACWQNLTAAPEALDSARA